MRAARVRSTGSCTIERYGNRQGRSGIRAYATGTDWIDVKFGSGEVYRYHSAAAGRPNIDEMKALAQAGRGLSTFISRNAAVLQGVRIDAG